MTQQSLQPGERALSLTHKALPRDGAYAISVVDTYLPAMERMVFGSIPVNAVVRLSVCSSVCAHLWLSVLSASAHTPPHLPFPLVLSHVVSYVAVGTVFDLHCLAARAMCRGCNVHHFP